MKHFERHLMVAVGLAALTPAIAGAAWSPSVEVGVSDATGSRIDVEVTTQGAALAGWTKNALTSGAGPGVVQYAYRPAGGAFGAAVSVDPKAPEFPGPSQPPTPGRIATINAMAHLTPDGVARALWRQPAAGQIDTTTSPDGVTYAAPPGLIWAGVMKLMRSDQNVLGDVAAVSHEGAVVLKRATAAVWYTLLVGERNIREAAVSVDPGGRALIAWIDLQGRVKARRFNLANAAAITPTRVIAVDSALSASAVDLQTTGFRNRLEVGTDAAGRGVIVWQRNLAGRRVVRAAFVTPTLALRAPGVRTVSRANRVAGDFDAAMAPNGTASIVWVDLGPSNGPTSGSVGISRRTASAANWSAPTRVAPGGDGIGIGTPSVAMAGNLTYVGWLSPGASFGQTSMQAARRVGTGAWARTTLQGGFDDRGAASPDLSARGSWAVAGWRDTQGACCGGYRVSLWSPTS